MEHAQCSFPQTQAHLKSSHNRELHLDHNLSFCPSINLSSPATYFFIIIKNHMNLNKLEIFGSRQPILKSYKSNIPNAHRSHSGRPKTIAHTIRFGVRGTVGGPNPKRSSPRSAGVQEPGPGPGVRGLSLPRVRGHRPLPQRGAARIA